MEQAMSFDIFVGMFKGGEGSTFPLRLFKEAFAGLLSEREEHGYKLFVPSWGWTSGFVYIDEEEACDGFMINRPPFCRSFTRALLNLLKSTDAVLYWPGEERSCAVARAELIAELPLDMIESLGEPHVVAHEIDIVRAIDVDPACLDDE
jgi:hypothetical protein